MSSFYHCYSPAQSPRGRPTTSLPSSVCDMNAAIKCINKASLALPDIALKLQLKQVTSFLEHNSIHFQQQDGPKYPQHSAVSANQSDVAQCQESIIRVHLPKHQQDNPKEQHSNSGLNRPGTVYPIPDNIQCQTAKSLLLGKISQSAISKQLMGSNLRQPSQIQASKENIARQDTDRNKENSCQEDGKEQWKLESSDGGSGLRKILKWRSVVTRNALEQHDTNKRVGFASEQWNKRQSWQLENSTSLKLRAQNEQLRQGLLQIMACLQDKIHINVEDNASVESLLSLAKQCCYQLQENISESDCHPISMQSMPNDVCISGTILEQSRQVCQKQELQQMHSQIQKMRVQLEQSRMECQKYKELAQRRAQEVKKYELLLFVKEEEIASLKVIAEAQEKKSINSGVSSPTTRTYKKYFQHLENNFSAMSNFSSTN